MVWIALVYTRAMLQCNICRSSRDANNLVNVSAGLLKVENKQPAIHTRLCRFCRLTFRETFKVWRLLKNQYCSHLTIATVLFDIGSHGAFFCFFYYIIFKLSFQVVITCTDFIL